MLSRPLTMLLGDLGLEALGRVVLDVVLDRDPAGPAEGLAPDAPAEGVVAHVLPAGGADLAFRGVDPYVALLFWIGRLLLAASGADFGR